MTRRTPLPPALAAGPFVVATAVDLSVPRSRLRAGDLMAPFHAIRTTTQATDVRGRAASFVPAMEPDEYFSHLTAAQLLGLRMPPGPQNTLLHVTSVARHRAHRRGAGIIGHNSATGSSVLVVDGLRTSSGTDTWCDLGATLAFVELVAMGDGLVCRKNPVATMAELERAVNRMGRRRGAKRLREALASVRANTDSYKETELRLVVIEAGCPEPEVNGEIRNEFGVVVAHGDLVFRLFRVILEYDGAQHREDERQFTIDVARLDDLMELGWRVIRVDKKLLRARARLIAKVGRALRAGGWRA